MVFDKPIIIEKLNADAEEWSEYFKAHAAVNKTGGSEYSNAGAERSTQTLTFALRYCDKLEPIPYNTQSYRIKYRGHTFNIKDTDLYMENRRENLKLVGESYGEDS